MKGTIKFFNAEKGFGFIAAEDGKEYFVHTSALPPGSMPREHDPITFDVVQGDKGLKAGNAKLGAAPAPQDDEETPMGDEKSSDEESSDDEKE